MLVGGVLFLSVAALCGIAGVAALKRNLTPFPKPSVETQFVQSGVYGLMRHPLYVAVLCASVGWALVWQSRPGLVAALVLALFLDAKARREERWLRERFPDYGDYQQRVRRFIPGVY
jgi:protein-S-isoprenylcysteine O-methyltransferase Ste14